MVLIVIWNRCWDAPVDIPDALPVGCRICGDRDRAAEADAVVFHLPSLNPSAILDAAIAKPASQVWVAWGQESEVHYPWLASPRVMRHFEIRMTHHLDSEIPVMYLPADFPSRLAGSSSLFCDFEHRREVLANAFVSSPFDASGRGALLKALMQRMTIDSFGRVEQTVFPHDADTGEAFKLATIAKYKFTLAFENACSLNYVTEKFFQPLLVGSVPVVLGAPDVARFAPGDDCYVDVRDFATVSALVRFLEAVGRDRESYARFHAWRTRPLRSAFFDLLEQQRQHPFVRLCTLLAAQRSPSADAAAQSKSCKS